MEDQMLTPPTVSAVMPTYNKGPWLQAAIDSVLGQTFSDWELIIVDDGSTDNTATVLAGCTDARIRVHTLTTNVGRSRARNLAIQQAKGRYIAICDSDDVSAPTRFEQHVAFLDSHPDVAVVSAYVRQLSERSAAQILFPTDHASIGRRFAKGKMGAAHGASMVRAVCFEKLGLYCEDLRLAEDFELFRRFSRHYQFQTLPEELLQYRNEFGAVPLRVWNECRLWHRYALYRSNCLGNVQVLSFEEFAKSLWTKLALYTVDSLRYAHLNLRAHVFSRHVLR
jgi:glycosyltransferase involved in cell wall biosynthesis